MKKILALLALFSSLTSGISADVTLTVSADKPTRKVSPMLYGLMTEEINHCYDGGLYAELVHNRAFLDDPKTPKYWAVVKSGDSAATITLDPSQPLNENIPTSLRFDVTSATPSAPGEFANEGYWGIPVKPSTQYKASFYAKASTGFSGPVTIAIIDNDGSTVYAKAQVSSLSTNWQNYSLTLKTKSKITTTTKARLVISVQHPGTVWFGLVSLFPPTWNNQPNGFRKDLMQLLVDLKPAFLRLPGGNYLEGDTIETRFPWKKTLGPIDQRPGHQGPWGYRSTDGLGLLEFLEWCEDMKAEPVLAVFAGYALKGGLVKAGPDLEPFVQEALEEIEYVTGSADTKWGAQRVKDGHPKPFTLHYVEIGNEDWFDRKKTYDARFAQFNNAIKKKYPELKCISSVGNEQPADLRVHSSTPDVLDEHYYRNADAFIKDSPGHFDKYNRHGPEIFVGEWAAHETSFPPWDAKSAALPPTPNMKAALGDAVWMAAMERNSDFVTMQCYAPLFVNVNDRQWRPDLIGYDALRSFGAPSYYAFRMFSRNVGDTILKADLSESNLVQGTVTRDSKSGIIYMKLVNLQSAAQPVKIEIKGVRSVGHTAEVETLAADPSDTNSMDAPEKVIPVKGKIEKVKPAFTYTLAPNSITVLKLRGK